MATEGSKTEPQYLNMLNSRTATVHVQVLKPGASAPASVLQRMQRHLEAEGIQAGDEAWLVVDKDQWPDTEIDALHQWATSAVGRGLAVSNPQFEYWLLLHFEDGAGALTSAAITQRLRRHLPNYDKSVTASDFSPVSISEAVDRARRRDTPACPTWPKQPGQTTVYRLVDRIRNA